MKRPLCLAFFLLLLPCLYAQTQTAEAPAATPAAIKGSYRSFSLGMSTDDFLQALQKDEMFLYSKAQGRIDPNLTPQGMMGGNGLALVSPSGSRDPSAISVYEAAGVSGSFIVRADFQFSGGKLYIMSFVLNQALMDHYSVYTALSTKYGNPASLNPQEAVWEQGNVRLSLEDAPLTVKYIDTQVFNSLLKQKTVRESDAATAKQEFLDEF
jgi:hypothetical protein